MDALDCALYTKQIENARVTESNEMFQWVQYTSKQLQHRGYGNQCTITQCMPNSESHYSSSNRCEKMFSNKGSRVDKSISAYDKRLELLFDRSADAPQPLFTISAPHILDMYEGYPFWHTLFTVCSI